MNTEYDAFIDYCYENDLDPEVEDFHDWRDRERERWIEREDDLSFKYSREN